MRKKQDTLIFLQNLLEKVNFQRLKEQLVFSERIKKLQMYN